MKKIIAFIQFSLIAGFSWGQTTNPFDSTGIKVRQSILLIIDSINAGSITDYSSKTIDEYTRLLPIQASASVEMIGTIYQAVNDGNFDLSGTFTGTAYTSSFTNHLIDICEKSKATEVSSFQDFIAKKVAAVQDQLEGSERDLLLQFCAIAYHTSQLYNSPVNASKITPEGGPQTYSRHSVSCYIDSNGEQIPVPCGVAGAIIGGTIGYAICGIPCSIGGAIIGCIIGIAIK